MPTSAARQPNSFDPRQIPPGERVAYVNRIADRAGADNASEFYDAAANAFKELWNAAARVGGFATRPPGQRGLDESALMLADTWSDEQARVVHAWLEINAGTLVALAAATDRAAYFGPLSRGSGRLWNAREPAHCKRLLRCARLLGVQANQAALVGDWPAAYAWNNRIHRMASHLYQQPTAVERMLGIGVERAGVGQLFSLLSRHAPLDAPALLARLSQMETRCCPRDLAARAESLAALDYIEACFEWAADPPDNPAFGKHIAFMIDPSSVIPGATPRSAFASVQDFRAALLKSSLESAWQARLEHDAICSRWEAQPFSLAWREVAQFRANLAALGDRAPVQKALYAAYEPGTDRCLRAVSRTRRNAAAVAVAALHYQRQRGCLPAGLDELRQPGVVFDATDLFSGEPLLYHPTDGGQSFVLYSVGPARQNDCTEPSRRRPAAPDFVYWPRLPECAKGS
jgi:hypothetical protein